MATRDEVFEALFECFFRIPYASDIAARLTTTERGRLNRAARELREVGATPDDVRVRWDAAVVRWPKITMTPTALAANWSSLATSRKLSSADAFLARHRA